MKNQPTLLSRFLYPALAFAIALGVYLRTLCPTVYVGDSGEFITNAVTLGINHPTGYPLYTILGRLFVMMLSWWSAAQAVNIVSALCCAGAVVCMYFASMQLSVRPVIAFAIALFYAFSSTLWSHATTAEVYPLSTLMVGLSVFAALRWY